MNEILCIQYVHLCCPPLHCNYASARLQISGPSTPVLPLGLQQSNLKPQPREFQDHLTALLYGLFMKHMSANSSVTVS